MRTPRDPIYAGHRYPAEIISYAVWLYFRFPLSLRMVEEMLAARGISVTHETIRQWGLKFGREFAGRHGERGRGKAWRGRCGAGNLLRGVAVFAVSVEPAHGRGDAGGPRHLGDARDDPAMGPQIRPGIRRPTRRAWPRESVERSVWGG